MISKIKSAKKALINILENSWNLFWKTGLSQEKKIILEIY